MGKHAFRRVGSSHSRECHRLPRFRLFIVFRQAFLSFVENECCVFWDHRELLAFQLIMQVSLVGIYLALGHLLHYNGYAYITRGRTPFHIYIASVLTGAVHIAAAAFCAIAFCESSDVLHSESYYPRIQSENEGMTSIESE